MLTIDKKNLEYLSKKIAIEIFNDYFNRIPPNNWQRKYLEVHRKRIIHTLTIIPIANSDGLQVLDAGTGGFMLEWLTDYLKYDKSFGTIFNDESVEFKQMSFKYLNQGRKYDTYHMNMEKHSLPCESEKFSLIVFCEVLEHFQIDPMFFLIEANRVLKSDGLLLLTTPNSAGQIALQYILNGQPPYNYYAYNKFGQNDGHRFEYTPSIVSIALESAGFEIIELTTQYDAKEKDEELEKFLASGNYNTELRGDRISVLAKKVSVPRDRYPHPLYRRS
ncbi:2-polyprenyl-3-methyl-5-hydroxy-6-metoxy-1,4-benzoquinol methylase [Xenococcus sp. PCC 7305]|uniref:class I SAM-dependent methyltransferase n=1 Tax=Xenococcus sp. PCC 7305 TaxID=102125 RepID=UPI0002ACF00E|nr:class I SAM-dependent methyltransferase [Xenococcus sp. PCC 7305]ELS03168.1 2-polyprenyl-3-methyl-5-hydroxy-6-metoxy-1,4-benzoquinol methylase [Xenococcus sp. PCC 7305]